MLTRRELLLLGGLGALATVTGCVPFIGGNSADGAGASIPPGKFDGRALPIPPLLAPDANGRYVLRAQAGTTELVAGVLTATWGFNGAVLGPTIRALKGDRVRMRIENGISEETTVHWHGMELPAEMDGGPHQPISPGGSWEPEWTIDQPAATLWYHPHPHGSTAEHVYKGLAGLFIVEDPDTEDGLPSEYGVDDIPVILQDRTISTDGSLSWNSEPHVGLIGATMIVNGAHAPTFTAARPLIRLRILAATNARKFNLAFSDDRPFHVIANDAGLLQSPVEVPYVSISPGERVEILLAVRPRDAVVLETRSGTFDIDNGDHPLLQILGAAGLEPLHQVPQRLPGPAAVGVQPGATRRTFELSGTDEINGREMSPTRIDTVVPRGAKEIWQVENRSPYAHNFHIHGCSFKVLEYDGAAPPPWMAGRKDTVFVPPRSGAILAVEFADYANEEHPYMYHCHILRHEDKGMMGQFLVVDHDRVNDAPLLIESNEHTH